MRKLQEILLKIAVSWDSKTHTSRLPARTPTRTLSAAVLLHELILGVSILLRVWDQVMGVIYIRLRNVAIVG
jgi:hypothetical protein